MLLLCNRAHMIHDSSFTKQTRFQNSGLQLPAWGATTLNHAKSKKNPNKGEELMKLVCRNVAGCFFSKQCERLPSKERVNHHTGAIPLTGWWGGIQISPLPHPSHLDVSPRPFHVQSQQLWLLPISFTFSPSSWLFISTKLQWGSTKEKGFVPSQAMTRKKIRNAKSQAGRQCQKTQKQ